ncbi:hypothetical protein C8J56DRAFT_840139 [Mycena floridula]|nr:hypothetical protein C8J56DRAFT_840139 [Mycena floridula]
MAVPQEFTILDMSGKFTVNKALSDIDKADSVLALQGIEETKRQAIQTGNVTLSIKHYTDNAGVEHVDIETTVAEGMPVNKEERLLDGKEYNNHHPLFGTVRASFSRTKPSEIKEEYLKNGWSTDSLEHGLVYVVGGNGTTWSGKQTWGIEEVNGERRYTRHMCFSGAGGEQIHGRLVYDMIAA